MSEIYLDNAATTKPLAELKEVYEQYAGSLWYNPSARYAQATRVERALEDVRRQLLAAFGSSRHRCVFTGSGTEAANTVILRGISRRKDMNLVCGAAEHPCVRQAFSEWEQQGCEVRWVRPEQDGCLHPEAVAALVDEHTALVSAGHVNNETGALNDIAAIAAAVKARGRRALFHSDGVQAYMRQPAFGAGNIDYYTVSAHKLHGLKGTGAIFHLPGTPLKPYILGGGQEGGLRSGTQDVLGILAFGRAVRYFAENADGIKQTLAALRRAMLEAVLNMENVTLISPKGSAADHIVTLSFGGVNAETLLHALEADGIIVSNGAACSSKRGRSWLAQALGIEDEVANGIVRVSFSPFSTVDEVMTAVAAMERHAAQLRKYKRN